MQKELKSSKDFWNSMSKFGIEASVIDPHDKRGYKNRYIQEHRNTHISKAITSLAQGCCILDFGCGTGNITRYLNGLGMKAIGIDIAFDLLALSEQGSTALLNYDGRVIPFRSGSFDAAVDYVVLNHILNDDHLLEVLQEIKRVLKPGAAYICIEQTRERTKITDRGQKKQRSLKEFESLFSAAGLQVERAQLVRSSYFPLIYPIRYGLISEKAFPFIINLDIWCAARLAKMPFGYFDTLFILRKPNT